jgi:hypothetical protein
MALLDEIPAWTETSLTAWQRDAARRLFQDQQGLSVQDCDDLLHNNLGYCLNACGDHARAEAHCRAAIAIADIPLLQARVDECWVQVDVARRRLLARLSG